MLEKAVSEEVDYRRLSAGLSAVARAMNDGNDALAHIALVSMRLPKIVPEYRSGRSALVHEFSVNTTQTSPARQKGNRRVDNGLHPSRKERQRQLIGGY